MNTKTMMMALAAVMAVGVALGAVQKRIDDSRVLVGNMYFPMCRTEGPDKIKWPKDLAKMKELGYQCLHGFCEWSRVEKEKGVYDFSDLDLLLGLCRCAKISATNIAVEASYMDYANSIDGRGGRPRPPAIAGKRMFSLCHDCGAPGGRPLPESQSVVAGVIV